MPLVQFWGVRIAYYDKMYIYIKKNKIKWNKFIYLFSHVHKNWKLYIICYILGFSFRNRLRCQIFGKVQNNKGFSLRIFHYFWWKDTYFISKKKKNNFFLVPYGKNKYSGPSWMTKKYELIKKNPILLVQKMFLQIKRKKKIEECKRKNHKFC